MEAEDRAKLLIYQFIKKGSTFPPLADITPLEEALTKAIDTAFADGFDAGWEAALAEYNIDPEHQDKGEETDGTPKKDDK